MNCKICKIPLRDNSYTLDIYRKEEIVCPYQDDHEEIIEKRLEKYPTQCPICESSWKVEMEVNIYRSLKGKIIISCEHICPCGFGWTIIGDGVPIYEEGQLNEYGEWE